MPAAEPSEDTCRVGVFLDWQNCYRSARDAFGFGGSGIAGNVRPLMLGRMLAQIRLEGQGQPELVKERIYTGQASQRHDARTYAANRRQFQSWRNSSPCIEVVTRTLDYSLGRPREKGIDVRLAIDLVRTALFEDEHDISVIVSADTDLLPALELIVERRGSEAIEVAAWQGPHWSPSPLAIAGQQIRQHMLTRAIYDRIADTTDYNAARERSVQALPYGRRPRPPKS